VAQQVFDGDRAIERFEHQRRLSVLIVLLDADFQSAKAGDVFATVSSSESLPSSTSIIAATEVIGFDIEYRRKIVSAGHRQWVATSRTPKFSK